MSDLKPKTTIPNAPDSPYTEVLVFHQAICKSCGNVIMLPPPSIRLATTRADLEQFSADAHLTVVREKKLLCVNPQLTILFGHALELTSNLPKQN